MGESLFRTYNLYVYRLWEEHTWTRCEHENHIQKELGPRIQSKFFLLWDSNIKNLTTKPPTTEKLLYNLYYCKRPHFISFHFYWHRRTDTDVHPQGSSCSFATCSFTLHLLLPKGHGHIKCCHSALQAGQRLEGSRTTESAYDLMTTLGSPSLPRPAWSFQNCKSSGAALISASDILPTLPG